MAGRAIYQVDWWSQSLIVAAATLTVGLAGDEQVTPNQIGRVDGLPLLRFGLLADQAVTVLVDVSVDQTNWRTQVNATGIAGTWFDAYALPAPVGDSGFVVLGGPWARIRLTNTGAADLTYLYFWASAGVV